ncbi:terminase small subunit [Rhizobium calliandrae]|uniref:Terminase small subunit n=1 Tax=Rhizobium calliandrae TaxID=1312182 RepID=A0ABT7KL50_9HYPH|nr:terminase small subunit [Rhizobium calliandrae]MDL2408725.1 terminase small subunit [Rhizobium calliandrae]
MSKIDDIKTSDSAIGALADWEEGLTHREIRFVREYLIDLDPKRAAIEAGYSKTVAASKAYQWVSNGKVKPHVFAAVQSAMKARANRTDITADRVLKELAKIGFADIRRAVTWQTSLITEEDNPDGGDVAVIKNIVTNNVQLIASEDIDDETAAAIAEISQNAAGGLKIKLHDKRAALVDIGKHLGMFVERTENVNTNFVVSAQPVTEEEWLAQHSGKH